MKLKILFLTNNQITNPLCLWLRKKHYKVYKFTKPLNKTILQKINPDIIISYNYKYIIKKEFLTEYYFINLHISYLPFNRGAHPNIWSFIENTKKGVTIHLIDEGIDTGDILVQKRVVLDKKETFKSTYKKLHFHIQMLFKQNFKKIINQKIKPKQQPKQGTFHISKELPPNIDYSTPIYKILKEINANRKTQHKR
ncbi:formyl transferase [Caminibacter mediatlanticus TB-2]|uniref:Formyl transferase n=1 Tax=Caminibacter mediatlanticus TB-2 TaxID=391592 RepID=A0AAI9AHF1_9BACT|nr:formyltransferase family protein [Caminibacter mediatlanticus]EDM23565.1 formyl transferase domain protein [Caminibacter mediatlanticus TB-2]QCT93886.1 formyl transferase [Caminibacter mediatlanticus TB-2]